VRPNVDRLKQGYQAFAERDIEAVLDVFADDVQWEMPAAAGLPEKGSFYGKDEIAWMIRQRDIAYGEGLQVVPTEFIAAGDTVVVLGTYEGTPNGNRFSVPYCTVCRFAAGEVRRLQTIFDTAVVVEALGRGDE
jgi:ketosteroid isomerase-like protein